MSEEDRKQTDHYDMFDDTPSGTTSGSAAVSFAHDEEPTRAARRGDGNETKVDIPNRLFPAKKGWRPRGLTLVLIAAGVLLLVFAGALAALPYILPTDTIRGIAKNQARELAGVDVDFKSLGFGWNGSVVVEGVTVAPLNPDDTPGTTLLSINEVRTNVAISALLSGTIVVNNLDVSGMSVTLVKGPDGTLNLPDFSRLAVSAEPAAPGRPARVRLSMAHAAESAALPLEVHNISLDKALLTYDDRQAGLTVAAGLENVTVQGKTLDDPFRVRGEFLPYPQARNKGVVPFTGEIAMLKNLEPDLVNGKANLELEIQNVQWADLAAQAGLGDLLPAGQASGTVRAGFAGGQVLLAVPGVRLDGARVGLGSGMMLDIPQTDVTADAVFDPNTGVATLRSVTLANALTTLRANGWAEGVYDLADGVLPVVAADYTGEIDFARAADFAAGLGLDAGALPALAGRGVFGGKVQLPRGADANAPIAPEVSFAFTDGVLTAQDAATDITARVPLRGFGAQAIAKIGSELTANAQVRLAGLQPEAVVPALTKTPVRATLNGTVTASVAGEQIGVRVQLDRTTAEVPPTQWSSPLTLTAGEVNMTYTLLDDTLRIENLPFDINNRTVYGQISSDAFTGIAAGKIRGQADLDAAAAIEALSAVVGPLMPPAINRISGQAVAKAAVKLEDNLASIDMQAQIAEAGADIQQNGTRAEVRTPRFSFRMIADGDIKDMNRFTLTSFEGQSAETTLQAADAQGWNAGGRLGAMKFAMTAEADLAAGRAEVSTLQSVINGLTVVAGTNGTQDAGLEMGALQAALATPEHPIVLPVTGEGTIALPSLDAAIGNLVFYLVQNGQRIPTNIGTMRARLGLEGYIGTQQEQLINLTSAAFAATPFAGQLRGRYSLDTGALVAQYAGRLAPAGLAPILEYFGLPASTLDEAAASGLLSYNGSRVDSKGTVQGSIRIEGAQNPFESNHDVSAEYENGVLTLAVRRLDGAVKNANGEAVISLAAQPSNLQLSSSGQKGLLDIRVTGGAEPTRHLALGFLRVIPGMRDVADMMQSARAGGVYQGWIQIKELEGQAVGLSAGGLWKGAALQVGSQPYLSESGQLAASLDGNFSFANKRLDVSRVFFKSDAAQIQAEGTAQAQLDSQDSLQHVATNMRFIAADLSKLPLAFPGVVPADMGLTGKVQGQFAAGGTVDNIRVEQAVMQFSGVKANAGLAVEVPNGQAQFGCTLSLAPHQASGTGSPYEVLTMVNIADGQAVMQGLRLEHYDINQMAAQFELQNGVLTLRQARIQDVGGSYVMAQGGVDFRPSAPVVDMQLGIREMALKTVNSQTAEYFEFDDGLVTLPADGKLARVRFAGFSEDEILRTIALDNFTFQTTGVTLLTGPYINEQLGSVRSMLKTTNKQGTQAAVITFQSVSGTVQADGRGTITIPTNAPVVLIGDNTGDFKVQGVIRGDRTMEVQGFVTGKLQNLINFNIPNLIPNFRLSESEETANRFMNSMNEYASQDRYGINVTGTLDNPDLAGIPGLVSNIIADFTKAVVGGGLVGGSLDMLKDTTGGVLSAPGNLLKGVGGLIPGVGGAAQQNAGGQQPAAEGEAGQQQQQARPQDALRGLGRAFGIR